MILVTGGTGFIGKILIRQLVENGQQVRTLLRPSVSSPTLPRGVSIEVAVCSLRDERGLRAAMKGVDVVYHLAGSERLGSRADLAGVDVDGTRMIAEVAAKAGVERLFTVSHLGADRASAYPVLKAKAIAEHAVINSGVHYTIFRTGPVFGPGDQFTVPLARLIRMNPAVFLMPGNGSSLIQPLWVEDLVTCLTWALEEPTTMDHSYAVGGLDVLSFQKTVVTIMNTIGIHRPFFKVSPAYLRMLAVWVEHNNPKFPLSIYWLDYLSADRTCATDSVPRLLGLMPARFHQLLDYLKPAQRISKKGRQF